MARKLLNRLPPNWINKASVPRAPVHLRSRLMICNRSRESRMESKMPENDVISRAKARRKARKALSTQAGEFVGEEIELWMAPVYKPGNRHRNVTRIQICFFNSAGCRTLLDYGVQRLCSTRFLSRLRPGSRGLPCVGWQRSCLLATLGGRNPPRPSRVQKRHSDEQKEYWTWRHDHHDGSPEKLFEDLPCVRLKCSYQHSTFFLTSSVGGRNESSDEASQSTSGHCGREECTKSQIEQALCLCMGFADRVTREREHAAEDPESLGQSITTKYSDLPN